MPLPASKNRNLWIGTLLALFAILIWGSTFVTTKQLLAEKIAPVQILFVRFILGYLLLWVLYPRHLPWQGRRAELQFAALGLLGITLYFLFENLALIHGDASMVAVVVCISPLSTTLLQRCFTHQSKLRYTYWIGFVLSICGVVCVCTHGDLSRLSRLGGAVPALLGAVTWSFYSIINNAIKCNVSPLALTRRSFFWGLIFMIPLCLISAPQWVPLRQLCESQNLWRILFLGIVASALCYSAWNQAVIRIGSIKTAILLYLNPVVGVAAGALILHEELTVISICGSFLTIAGVVLSSLNPRH